MTNEAEIRVTGEADVSRMRAWTAGMREATEATRQYTRAVKEANEAGRATGAAPAPGAPFADWRQWNRESPVPWHSVSYMQDEQAREMREAREARSISGGSSDPLLSAAQSRRLQKEATGLYRFGYGKAMGALGMLGLGGGIGGIMSWLFQSGQEHLQQGIALKELEQRFGSIVNLGAQGDRSWQGFGHALGYVNSQMVGLVQTLGAQTNQIGPEFQRYGGFARATGLDASAAMGVLGTIQRLAGLRLGTEDLAELKGRANRIGMGRGRFGEYLSGVERQAMEEFKATGVYGGAGGFPSFALSTLPSLFFPGSEAGRGEMGQELLGNMNQAMTGTAAARTFLLRSMGYGRDPNVDWFTANERLEAGIYGEKGAQNMLSFFGSMRGWSRNQMGASMKMANPSMPTWQIKALVDTLQSETGWGEFQKALTPGGAGFSEEFLKTLSPDQRRLFQEAGWEGLGGAAVSEGERLAVEKERQRATEGGDMADAMENLNATLNDLRGALENFTGTKLGEAVRDLTEFLKASAGNTQKYGLFGSNLTKDDWKEVMAWALSSLDPSVSGKSVSQYETEAGFR